MQLCCVLLYAYPMSSFFVIVHIFKKSPHPAPSLALGLQDLRGPAHSCRLTRPLPPQHEHHHARLPLGGPLGAPGVIPPRHGTTAVVPYEVKPAPQVFPRRGDEPPAAVSRLDLPLLLHGPDAPVLARQQDLVALERAGAAGLVEEVVVPVQVSEVLADLARREDGDERVREEGQGGAVPERGDQVEGARHVRRHVGGRELSILLLCRTAPPSCVSSSGHLTTPLTHVLPVLPLEAPKREPPPVLCPAPELLDLLRYAACDGHDARHGEHDERRELAAHEQHEGEQRQPPDVVAPAATQQLGRPRGAPRGGPLCRRRGRGAGRGVVGRDAARGAEGPHQPRVDVDVAEARLVEGQVGLACREEVCGGAGVWPAGREGQGWGARCRRRVGGGGGDQVGGVNVLAARLGALSRVV